MSEAKKLLGEATKLNMGQMGVPGVPAPAVAPPLSTQAAATAASEKDPEGWLGKITKPLAAPAPKPAPLHGPNTGGSVTPALQAADRGMRAAGGAVVDAASGAGSAVSGFMGAAAEQARTSPGGTDQTYTPSGRPAMEMLTAGSNANPGNSFNDWMNNSAVPAAGRFFERLTPTYARAAQQSDLPAGEFDKQYFANKGAPAPAAAAPAPAAAAPTPAAAAPAPTPAAAAPAPAAAAPAPAPAPAAAKAGPKEFTDIRPAGGEGMVAPGRSGADVDRAILASRAAEQQQQAQAQAALQEAQYRADMVATMQRQMEMQNELISAATTASGAGTISGMLRAKHLLAQAGAAGKASTGMAQGMNPMLQTVANNTTDLAKAGMVRQTAQEGHGVQTRGQDLDYSAKKMGVDAQRYNTDQQVGLGRERIGAEERIAARTNATKKDVANIGAKAEIDKAKAVAKVNPNDKWTLDAMYPGWQVNPATGAWRRIPAEAMPKPR